MTWEEKLYAIKAISPDVSLYMRHPGDWGVSARLELAKGGMLESIPSCGKTPEEAVDDYWRIYSTAPTIKCGCRYYHWNICVWVDITEQVKVEAIL